MIIIYDFFTAMLADVNPWSLSDSKPSKVSRNLFNILAGLNNVLVVMVSAPPLSNSSSHFIKILGIVPGALPTPSFSVPLLIRWQGLGTWHSFRFLWVLLCGLPGRESPLFGRFSFSYLFLITITRSVLLVMMGDLFVFLCPSELYASHSPGGILVCPYTIWLHGQISISCTIPSASLSPLIHV